MDFLLDFVEGVRDFKAVGYPSAKTEEAGLRAVMNSLRFLRKAYPAEMGGLVAAIINQNISTCTFPNSWKCAVVTVSCTKIKRQL